MSEITTIAPIADAELDLIGAGTNYSNVNIVGLFAAVQTNISFQTSANVLSIGSGNQYVYQSNNASVG